MAENQLTRKELLEKAHMGATDLTEALHFLSECCGQYSGEPIPHSYGLEHILDCLAERANRVTEQIEMGGARHE